MNSTDSLKIAVIGAGAMGSIYAVMMAEAGHEVWAVDSWQAHVEAINASGLRLEGPGGDRRLTSITATSKVNEVGACDLYVIAT